MSSGEGKCSIASEQHKVSEEKVPTYCFQCANGPDPFIAIVKGGVVTRIEPNYELEKLNHPSKGRICARAYSLILKLYNPKRIKKPLIRTNPNKGWDQDPQWKEISWDEALDILAEKLREIRKKGILDEFGRPRLAITAGGGGIFEGHQGTLPAFLSAWGPIDMSIGSGQGYKCYHAEHIFNEWWHRAFIVAPDTPLCKWVIAFGANTAASRGVAGNRRHAEARVKGIKRIQVEPHMSVTSAVADEWIPIKPKTDAAFLYAMIHVILHEMDWKKVCDLEFLKKMTNSPYLIGPNGYYCRDSETLKPLVWDTIDNKAKTFDDPTIKDVALTGEYEIDCVEVGPDDKIYHHNNVKVKPAFQLLLEHTKEYTPEWASRICDVPTQVIRRIAKEYIDNAMVGAIIEIDGEKLPYRPVAIELGKSVNNGIGSYQATWARTVLAILVGALEVPGGMVGVGSRLNPPIYDKWQGVLPGPDGFMLQIPNPTDKDTWPLGPPYFRAAITELTPLLGLRGWAQGVAGYALAWLFLHRTPENWPNVNPPDVWIFYRANPIISFHDQNLIVDVIKKAPFVVVIGYVMDDLAWFADLILPEHSDMEGLQIFRFGCLCHTFENFWPYFGFALKQPVIKPLYNTKDATDIWTEIASRVGILDRYNEAINRGAISLGQPLSSNEYDYRLDLKKKYRPEEIWDRVCKVVTRWLSGGRDEKDLNWFKKHGFYVVPFPKVRMYLHPIMRRWGLRYELPYCESIKRIGEELKNRLHERNINWWDEKLREYEALPHCRDFSDIWDKFYGSEYDMYLITTRSIQYSYGNNAFNPLSADVSKAFLDFPGVSINPKTAKKKGIKDGDLVFIESPRGKVKARAIVREGIRPDTLLLVGQFGHKITPIAKDLNISNINQLATIDMELIDELGGMTDLIKVKIYKAK